jgi:DHA1 family multidrug resistance protein-like MFS transporter
MVAPILPGYAESFDVPYVMVGLVISSFALTRVFLDMPAGFLGRKYDKRVIMILGLLLIVVASVLAGLAPTYSILILARMMEGAGSALYVTSATVFLAQITGSKKRGSLMSVYSGTLLLGSIFGPTFGGLIAAAFDIRAPFFAYAVVAGFGIIPTLVLPKLNNSEHAPVSDEKKSSLQDMRVVLKHPSFLLATFATFTLFFIRTGVRSTLVPLFAANNLGYGEAVIGIMLTLAALATASTMVPMGALSDRIGRRNPLIAALLVSAVVTLLIPLSTDLFSLTLCMIAYGAGVGLSGPIAAYITDVSPQDKLEVSMGLYRMISDFGFIAGPLLLGFLADLSVASTGGTSETQPIGMLPFIVAPIIMILAALTLSRADDPARKRYKKGTRGPIPELPEADSFPLHD